MKKRAESAAASKKQKSVAYVEDEDGRGLDSQEKKDKKKQKEKKDKKDKKGQ